MRKTVWMGLAVIIGLAACVDNSDISELQPVAVSKPVAESAPPSPPKPYWLGYNRQDEMTDIVFKTRYIDSVEQNWRGQAARLTLQCYNQDRYFRAHISWPDAMTHYNGFSHTVYADIRPNGQKFYNDGYSTDIRGRSISIDDPVKVFNFIKAGGFKISTLNALQNGNNKAEFSMPEDMTDIIELVHECEALKSFRDDFPLESPAP